MDIAGGTLTEQQVRERAYFIWEREGCPHGRDCEHWVMAERELLDMHLPATIAKPAAQPKKAAKAVKEGNGVAKAKGASGKAAPRKAAAKSVPKSASKSASKSTAKPATKSVASAAAKAVRSKTPSKGNAR